MLVIAAAVADTCSSDDGSVVVRLVAPAVVVSMIAAARDRSQTGPPQPHQPLQQNGPPRPQQQRQQPEPQPPPQA